MVQGRNTGLLLALWQEPPERPGRMETVRQRKRAEARRLLLDLVAELGNVSEACRRLGVDRSAYYRILKVTGGGGPEAFPRRRVNAASAGLEKRVLQLCLEFPEWGCDRLAHYLTLTEGKVSSPTVQKLLLRNGLGKAADRRAEAGRRAAAAGSAGDGGIQVSP